MSDRHISDGAAELAEPARAVMASSLADASPFDASASLLPFACVAIGASAGGVDALQRLFHAMPPDPGCAFLVVMHLDPERPSMLAPLLGRATTMPVVQAKQGEAIEANHVYIVPPGEYLEVRQGRLTLSPIRQRPPRPKAVDQLMASLAQDQRERAIGVVLTGTDGDGALGVKAIKGEGGITIAQSPGTAAHASMPASAVATGMVDTQLRLEDIPAALLAYIEHAPLTRPAAPDAEPGDGLQDVLAEVRSARGLDFRGYKTPMLMRRVQRRMGLTHRASMEAYLELLREAPGEVAALADDLLIGVTEFFREPDAWGALGDDIVPKMLAHKLEGDPVRVWVPACATGEEAYSVGMVLLEHSRVTELDLRVQVFATDIDRRALDLARVGHYSATIEQAVSPARLRRFFVRTEGGYQVGKPLRERVLFAPHNLVSDPPFSHMDLVSCRNLLIYMTPELQRQVLRSFHFALDPDRYLFLGKSETVGSLAPHFAPASQRARIYRRTGAARLAPVQLSAARVARGQQSAGAPAPAAAPRPNVDHGKLLRESLLEHRVGAALLTDRAGHVLYIHGDMHGYLQHPEGAPTAELFSMLHDDLTANARAALHKAAAERRRAESTTMMGGRDGSGQPVRLVASPAGDREDLFLITFEALEPDRGGPLHDPAADSAALRALEDELRSTKRELRTAIEELEATNEELKVANEEAMSVNEELQSSNEELETSKEELQSVNEELTTVNNELQEKVAELERSNNDLGNLLSSTHIPTLFLDRTLRIKRYTPAATRLFSLIATDIERPLSDITARCDMRTLLEDARSVLENLAPIQRADCTDGGESFLRRTMPYRTREDRIDGVVVTFIDITELERAAEGQRRFATVMKGSSDAIIVHDLQGKVLAWNRGAHALYGYPEEEALGAPMASLLPDETRGNYEELMRSVLAGRSVQAAESKRRTRNGDVIDVSTSLSVVRDDAGVPTAVALIERDITRSKRAQGELQASERRFRTLADSAPVLIWTTNDEGRIEFANRECATMLGQSAAALQGRRWTDLMHPDDAERLQQLMRAGPAGRVEVATRVLVEGGTPRWMKLVLMPRTRDAAVPGGIGHVGCMIDIHSQREAEEALREADRRKDEFLAMLGHELRNPLAPIRNAAEVLKRVGGDDTRVAWVRETLVRQVDHVTRLVDDLLDISRITRGAMGLRLEPVDLGFTIARAIDAVRPLLERKRHRFESKLPPQPLWVEGDAIRLTQVFENLLTNAAKYTDEGGEVSISMVREDNRAVVHVCDNGLGIAPAMRARVFELFVQDERAVDRSQGGLGIGLALVRHLVELHSGEVEAVGRTGGRGSDFVVRLPLISEARQPQPHRHDLHEPGRGGRVMIVDDDAESAESLALVLELSGFEIARAHDLESALATARRFEPDAVVMDIAMPVNDGFDVTRRLRAMPELVATRYIALTGFGHAEDFERTRRAGFSRHFVKPVDPQELEDALRTLLAGNDGKE